MAAMAVGPGGFPSFPAHFFERSPVWMIARKSVHPSIPSLDQLPRIIFHVLLVAMTPRLHEMLTSARSMCHAPMLRFFRFARWVTRAVSWAQVLTLLVAGMFMSRPAYVPELSVWAALTVEIREEYKKQSATLACSLTAIIQNTSCRLSHISVTAATSTEGRNHLTFSPAEKNQKSC
ncbi:uncharacterized protein AFUA_1G12320 [Aspergillus fumigatus Af293]|uniref:Uncharacterized protein n=2 Tax=Aspergillus fumigatus TaxID=746128 RepID=Q4WSM0_ASPFU|nr:hypothetical protein AFUA_1G12320 [Aspergillus fumigatus Af293]EAL90562.1 hypothetical protein AFUA_1G12320 [Aspergillus fumigatus Af293]EDP56468.1 hypothetical protein AFUB_011790 [Aspergillus fumigatus A1163]